MLNVGHLKSLHNQVGEDGVHDVLNNSLSQLRVPLGNGGAEHLDLTGQELEGEDHNLMFQVPPPSLQFLAVPFFHCQSSSMWRLCSHHFRNSWSPASGRWTKSLQPSNQSCILHPRVSLMPLPQCSSNHSLPIAPQSTASALHRCRSGAKICWESYSTSPSCGACCFISHAPILLLGQAPGGMGGTVAHTGLR